MTNASNIKRVRVTRTTGETTFSVVVGPRTSAEPVAGLPNRLLGHLLDHFCKASGLSLETESLDWPGSWRFDHVLCEDLGQLVGRGVAQIAEQLIAQSGIPGRADCSAVMDESIASVTLSFESRPQVDWTIRRHTDIDGFVDSWYNESGDMSGWCTGTNLRQFVDGFVFGSKVTLNVTIDTASNLHHLYEAIFRALGDAIRRALGLADAFGRLPGESSGFAGTPTYSCRELGD